MDTTKFKKIREEQFPLTTKTSYLDTSSTGLISMNAHSAMVAHLENRYEHAMDLANLKENWKMADGLRETVAEILHAEKEEIFFSDSCSSMINVFSAGIALEKEANVIVTGLTFPSTAYTWINRVGLDHVRFAEAVEGQIPPENIFALVDEHTAVISLCLVENTTGFRHDLESISRFCQERGIYLVVDATQAAGAMEIDVRKTPVDFLSSSCFKWLGCPFGIAFGYCSKRVMKNIKPIYVGWTGNKRRMDHSKYKLDLCESASRFETGSLNWLGLKGLKESLHLYLALGMKDVEDYILRLSEYLHEQVGKLDKVKTLGNFLPQNRSGITYLLFPEEWKLSNEFLLQEGIRANVASPTSLRVAVHYYNTKEDVRHLIEFLQKCEEKL